MLVARDVRLIACTQRSCSIVGSVHKIQLTLEGVLVEQTAAMKAGSSLLREHNVLGQL